MTTPDGLYTDAHAALNVERAGEKWRPSNGFEGEKFISQWCRQCQRDTDPARLCSVLAAAYAHDTNQSRYPTEWQYGADGQPKCTAFEELT